MKKFIYIIFLNFIFMAFSLPAFAGEKNLEGKVEFGAYLQGDNDKLDRAAEYKEDKSSPAGDVYFKGFNASSDILIKGYYEGESTNAFKLKGNLLRHIDVDYSFQRLFHRGDYDRLFIDYDINNFQPAVALKMEPLVNKPDGKVFGVNPFTFDNGTGSPGAQWFEFENDKTAIGKDYYIRRTDSKFRTTFSIPNLENVKLFFKGRIETRKGYEHKTVMVGKCTVCHVRGLRKDVDELTRDISGGIKFTAGPVTFSYSHMYRIFDENGQTLTTKFDNLLGLWNISQKKYKIFQPRLNPDTYNTVAEVQRNPDSRKHMDTFKMRLDLPYYTTLSAIYVDSNIENKDGYNNSAPEIDQRTFGTRFTTHLLKRKLTLTAKFRYVNIDSDDIFIDLNGDAYNGVDPNGNPITDPTKAYFNAATGEPVNFDFVRKSAIDRDDYIFGIDVVYRMLKNKLKLRLGYEYRDIDRDNYEVYPDEKKTEINKFKFGFDFKPFNKLSGRFKFTYSDIDNPFGQPKAGCIPETLMYDQNATQKPLPVTSYGGMPAYTKIYELRTYNGSASPSEIFDYKLNLNFMPMDKFNISVIGKYTDKDNDEGNTDWDGEDYMVGFDSTLFLTKNLVFTFGYNYARYEEKSKISVALYGGWGGHAFTDRVGSACDKVEYTADTNVFLANLDFKLSKQLSLSLSANYTLAEAEMDTPHFVVPSLDFVDRDQDIHGFGPPKFYITYISSDGGKTLDYSGFDDYSDLDYSVLDLTFNVNFDINEHWGIYGVFNLTDFNDDEEYVYGDLDGTYYSANIGIQYKF